AAGNHFASARLTRAAGDRGGSGLRLEFVSHSYFASVCFSRCDSSVSIRPISRRSRRNLLGCSSWPLCCCKRRWSLSWRKSRLFVSNSSVLSSVISRSEEHTSELQSLRHLVCRLLL